VYSPELLDHFQHPRNVGEIDIPDAVAQIENPACGDVLKLTVKLAQGEIADIRFKAMGCVAAIACGSAVTTLVKGKGVAEAAAIRREDVIAAVGGLPAASGHAAHLALDALAALLKELKG
jgi:NifU-like protein involved in Fe-S cluster formation